VALNAIDGIDVQSLIVRHRGDETVILADLTARGASGLEELLAPLAAREEVESLEVT
jgi:hypothetical protein